jgi:hypothetical protein
MKLWFAALALLALPATAEASNGLFIDSNNTLANVAQISTAGDGNRLMIQQTYDAGPGANTLLLTISGDLNGAPSASTGFSPLLMTSGLVPGHVVQSGHDNAISMTVAGDQNVFAVLQMGSGNRLTGTVTGSSNQAAVAQYGTGNALTFIQNGTGNMLSVIQRN